MSPNIIRKANHRNRLTDRQTAANSRKRKYRVPCSVSLIPILHAPVPNVFSQVPGITGYVYTRKKHRLSSPGHVPAVVAFTRGLLLPFSTYWHATSTRRTSSEPPFNPNVSQGVNRVSSEVRRGDTFPAACELHNPTRKRSEGGPSYRKRKNSVGGKIRCLISQVAHARRMTIVYQRACDTRISCYRSHITDILRFILFSIHIYFYIRTWSFHAVLLVPNLFLALYAAP